MKSLPSLFLIKTRNQQTLAYGPNLGSPLFLVNGFIATQVQKNVPTYDQDNQ
jgi:hypothetical protein